MCARSKKSCSPGVEQAHIVEQLDHGGVKKFTVRCCPGPWKYARQVAIVASSAFFSPQRSGSEGVEENTMLISLHS